MSGHSKWHNIRVKKSKVDAQRGKAFTKVSREVYMAARKGGGDPNNNFALKNAILRAREVNMPADNIKRVIEKAAGEGDGSQFEEIMYEGYGPHGVAMLMEVTTDNRNRTAADVRHLFSKYGGNLGESGCVAWLFQKRGLIILSASAVDEEKLLDVAIGAGAEDIKESEDSWEVITPADSHFSLVVEALDKAGIKHESAEVTMIPQTTVALGKNEARAVLKLMEVLEDLDDVQNVYANFDIPADVLEEVLGIHMSLDRAIIMGIDPGTATTGYGVIAADLRHCEMIAYGTIRTKPETPRAQRLRIIHDELDVLLGQYGPHCMAVEQLFFSRNVKTAMAVGEARGVLLLAAARRGIPIAEYTPTAVKQSLSGFGKADKGDIKTMVTWALDMQVPPRPDDAADALAIALCHLYASRLDGTWSEFLIQRNAS